jgi:exodeoxyribonuclease VII large subunit
VAVQGDDAPRQIASAIRGFNRLKIVDLLIVGRGGGSLEDLWAFNEEEVARAIHDSEIPVISAVGHEIDFSISDFVADLRAPTPSAAAELAVPDTAELAGRINEYARTLFADIQDSIDEKKRRLREMTSRYGLKRPMEMIGQRAQRSDELSRLLNLHMTHRMESFGQSSKSLFEKLEMVSPKAILGRGYAYCRDAAGVPVKSFRQVAVDDKLDVVFYEGGVESRVTRIKPQALDGAGGT